MTEDEMAGWHHKLSGHSFEQNLGDGEGQGNMAKDREACCVAVHGVAKSETQLSV